VRFRDITIADVTATGATQILTAGGMAGNPIGAVRWENVSAQGREAGEVRAARDWTMTNVRFLTDDGAPVRLTDCQDVALPATARIN
jgi:hypothetical protein